MKTLLTLVMLLGALTVTACGDTEHQASTAKDIPISTSESADAATQSSEDSEVIPDFYNERMAFDEIDNNTPPSDWDEQQVQSQSQDQVQADGDEE